MPATQKKRRVDRGSDLALRQSWARFQSWIEQQPGYAPTVWWSGTVDDLRRRAQQGDRDHGRLLLVFARQALGEVLETGALSELGRLHLPYLLAALDRISSGAETPERALRLAAPPNRNPFDAEFRDRMLLEAFRTLAPRMRSDRDTYELIARRLRAAKVPPLRPGTEWTSDAVYRRIREGRRRFPHIEIPTPPE